MQEIGVADVVAAARRVAARADSPLETTTLPL
jgi:hypothetical protein